MIFGSEYGGVYISIETKWLSTNSGRNAKVARNHARNKVKKKLKNIKNLQKGNLRSSVIGLIIRMIIRLSL